MKGALPACTTTLAVVVEHRFVLQPFYQTLKKRELLLNPSLYLSYDDFGEVSNFMWRSNGIFGSFNKFNTVLITAINSIWNSRISPSFLPLFKHFVPFFLFNFCFLKRNNGRKESTVQNDCFLFHFYNLYKKESNQNTTVFLYFTLFCFWKKFELFFFS